MHTGEWGAQKEGEWENLVSLRVSAARHKQLENSLT